MQWYCRTVDRCSHVLHDVFFQAAARLSEMYHRKVEILQDLDRAIQDRYDTVTANNPYERCLTLNDTRYPYDEKLNQQVSTLVVSQHCFLRDKLSQTTTRHADQFFSWFPTIYMLRLFAVKLLKGGDNFKCHAIYYTRMYVYVRHR